MLEELRAIVQEVNAARELQAALNIIVHRVREVLGTQVCSVFLLDKDINSHVLMASEGLRKEAVGQVSLSVGEGLVGLVAKHAEPINLQDASLHPSFHYLQETGEEEFHAFLGVPIIHHRSVLGVLIVQHKEKRRFDEGEYARSARPLRFVKRVSLTLIGPKLQPDERELGEDSDDDDS